MKKLMYILLFLLFAANVAAQESYVIDSVCVGAVRTYRMNGEKGSTYDWFLKDSLGFQVANPPYTDFRLDNDPNPGDTIWGSEINYVWSVVGEFDIMTLHYSVHGCDTIEQGRVKVFDPPYAFAGDDQNICTSDLVSLYEANAEFYSRVEWITLGDGVFDDASIVNPKYNKGIIDSIIGSVSLVFTAYGLAGNETCTPWVDTVEIKFNNPVLTLIPFDLLCYNDNSGIIVAEVSGNAPFTYEWTGPDGFVSTAVRSSGDTIAGLAAGSYRLKVTDNMNCEVFSSSVLSQPDVLTAIIDDVENVTCFGGDNGLAHVTAAGGTPGYAYLWDTDPFQYSQTARNLTVGTYTVTVSDKNSCNTFVSVTITEPEPLALSADSVDAKCLGKFPGSVDLTVTGGTPYTAGDPYRYKWNDENGVFASTEDIDNLAGDMLYTVVVTDSLGCLDTLSIRVNVEQDVKLTFSGIDSILCYGETGSIFMTVSDGLEPYNILWDNGTTTQDLINVPAGDYQITVTDANSCTIDTLIRLTQPELLQADISASEPAVCEDESISLNGNPDGGIPGYTHLWTGNGAAYLNTTNITDPVFSGASAGIYELIYSVTDENNCKTSDTIFLEIWPITDTIISVEICPENVPFSFNGSDYYSTGTYEYVTTNVYGCDSAITLDLTVYDEMQLTATSINAGTDNEAVGSIDLEVTGGTSPYTFLWNNGTTTEDVTGLVSGIYDVEVTDAHGCEVTYSVTVVTEPGNAEINCPPAIILASCSEIESSRYYYYSQFLADGGSAISSCGIDTATFAQVGNDEYYDGVFCINIHRRYIMQDSCGSFILCEQDIVVDDKVPPVMTGPKPVTFIGVSIPPEFTNYLAFFSAGGFAADNCGLAESTFRLLSEKTDNNKNPEKITRIYEIEDICGNKDTSLHVLFIYEESDIYINCPPDATVQCPEDIPSAFANYAEFVAKGGSAGTTGNVDLDEVSFTWDGDVSDGNSCPEIIARTYSISDINGKTASCTQTITIRDIERPELVIARRTYECLEDVPPRFTSRAQFEAVNGNSASDNCELDWSSFRMTGQTEKDICPRTIVRWYVIKDVCGNESVPVPEYIIIHDKISPNVVREPKILYADCEIPQPYLTLADFNGNSGGYVDDNCNLAYVKLSLLKEDTLKLNCPAKIIRWYRFTDLCDNYRDVAQIIVVNDTIAPEISCPPPLSFDAGLNELEGLTGLAYSEAEQQITPGEMPSPGILVSDNCGIEQITYQDDSTGDCPVIVTRTFTVYDACGNKNTCTQTIKLLRNIITVFNPLGPLCLNSVPPQLPESDLNGITGTWEPDKILTDKPGIFQFIFTPDASNECASRDILWIEIASDIVLTVTTVQDDASIRATGSIDLVVEGGNGPYKYSWSNGGATPKMENLPAGDYFVTVKDANGCIATLTVTVEAEELITEINCPPTITLECNADILVNPPYNSYSEFIAAGGSATSNCGIDTASFRFISQDTVPGAFCLNIKRSYSVADSCGTTVTCDQLVVVDDTEPPVLICPHPSSAECLSDVPSGIETIAEFIAAGGTVYDNCALDSASFTFTQIITKVINRTEITTTFSIFDLCGNQSSCDYIVVLNDNIPPLAKCNDITVYLDKFGNYILSEIDIEKISAGSSDNCTLPEDLIIDVEISEFNCADVESGAEVKVVVTDEAGNSANCTANITIRDTIPPEANCRDLVVYLDENGKAQVDIDKINNGSSDNCAIDTMFITPADFDCLNVGENEVVLTVIDAHSNESVCIANITVYDTISPIVNCVEPFTVQLDTNAHYLLAVEDIRSDVWDECGIDTVYLDRYDLDCEDIGTTIISLTAVDVNGNSATCETEITVFGNIAPNVLNDTVITAFNQSVSVDVAANDYDLKTEIDLATLIVRIKPQNGVIQKVLVNGKANGVLTYTPSPGFTGIDTLTYSICDDAIPCIPMCGTALVYIRVLPANNPPVAVDDFYNATCGPLTGNVMDNDYDDDPFDQIQTNTKPVKLPIHGDVTLESDGTFTYIPDEGFTGIDSFAYEICDNGAPSMCDTAMVYITKLPDNDCDGISDADDIDDDDDGILDVVEGLIDLNGDGISDNGREMDSDLDGIPDYLDIDSDDDGIVDNIEGQSETDYIYPIGQDLNNNGWDDAYDPAEGGYEFIPVDTDGDSAPDYIDIDSENDHVFDFIEGHDLNADGIPDVTRIFVDSDHDGLDDIYDTVNGWNDPYNSTNAIGSNAPLQDFDGDGTRDWRDENDEDDEFLTKDEDTNNDGDYSNDDMDLDGYPEYLDKTLDCELFIPEGFSPNDDGVHDFFQILCIQRYPNAHLMIFNRNGNKLFDKHYYGNLDVWGSDSEAWWWGNSENRLTLGRAGGLPTGNYVYVLELGNGEVKNGTVMISY